MRCFNSIWNYYVLALLYLSIILIDIPIGSKTVLHSPVIFVASVLFLIFLIRDNFKLKLSKHIGVFLKYIFASLILSLLILFVVSLRGDTHAYNKNLLVKNFEAFVSLALLHFLVFYLLIHIYLTTSIKQQKNLTMLIFISLTLIAFMEYYNPNLINFLHSENKLYGRLRLTTMESSQASLLYTVFSFMALFFIKNNLIKILIIAIYLLVEILITSRGLFLSLSFVLIILGIKYIKRPSILLLFIVSTFGVIFLIYRIIIPALISDIREFTSFSTRFSAYIASLLVLIKYPIGLGYGAYMLLYPPLLEEGYNFVNKIFLSFFDIQLSYLEIYDIISSGKNIGAKSGFFEMVMLSGWLGVLFWVMIYKRTFQYLKQIKLSFREKLVMEILVLFTMLQLIIGSEYTLLYALWIPIAFIESLWYKQKG
jgi:hypothetical protein